MWNLSSRLKMFECVSIIVVLLSLGACSDSLSGTRSTENVSVAVTGTENRAIVSSITPAPQQVTITSSSSFTTQPQVIPSISPVKSQTAQDWNYHWLKDANCKLPCWEGILPGKTSAEEGLQLLRANPLVDAAELAKPLNADAGIIKWTWLDSDPYIKNKMGGQAYYKISTSDHAIFYVKPEYSTVFKFSEVIQAYGEPSHVFAFVTANPDKSLSYNLYFLYLKNGFLIRPYDRSDKNINPELLLANPEIFSSSNNPFIDRKDLFVPWQGFKGFDFYCRKMQNNIVSSCS